MTSACGTLSQSKYRPTRQPLRYAQPHTTIGRWWCGVASEREEEGEKGKGGVGRGGLYKGGERDIKGREKGGERREGGVGRGRRGYMNEG